MKDISVLVVEDSKTQREYMLGLCRDFGITELMAAENGQVALDMIEQESNQFDILICDLEMPGIDGIELIHLLAARKQRSAILIVSGREPALISAVELMATTEGLHVLGAMQKPVQRNALIDMLQLYKGRVESKQQSSLSTPVQYSLSQADLELALQQRQFVLHYQPKIDMATGQMMGAEALVRMKGPDKIIFPNDFIHLCEQYHLIDQLSYEVVRMAAEQQQKWQALGFDIKVAVNLSAVSFDNDEFSKNIMDLMKQADIAADRLTFEVTETSVIQDMGKALAILTRLRLAGAGLSIDDYGTGYSSVKQLSQIPFTELKIDRSLINGISGKSHLQVIFESTLHMCSKLGITVVAEGIEAEADWNYLAGAGCNIAQGYYVSPPMPQDKFYDWWKGGMHYLK
ncbi:EAL domain-containing response regulator [Rheinheimera soli]|uniref:EAL domain-containing protein (Putative c-di-GMP-specific phosphodiesterase class I)/FixJ family two-component response regulator n=1 Tax=Rheinheimera soli TaxID=443616 RepID=A0ABU1W1G8_9GAMM|nr:EAL domain-containing response regulator [Rheinheimera soli]MDR7121786.1 EAL domain-containing protein (putative c-di-GMP-specific phosphodiesterase class I)/FixJ family two-component response regulator [Rheinheimera soli]